MTTYSDDFAGETVSSTPSNWTARWTTTNQTFDIVSVAEAEDDRVMRYVHTADAERLFSFDSMDSDTNRQDSEILVRFRWADAPADNGLYFILRGSGAGGTEDAYVAYLDVTAGIIFNWRFGRWDAGSFTGSIGGVSQAFDNGVENTGDDPVVDDWYYARFRVNSTTLSFSQWRAGEEEPTSFNMTATDSDLNVDGWTGVGCGAQDEVEVDYIGTGTNGDTAPLDVSTNTVVRTTAAYAEAVHQSSAPIIRTSAAYAEVVYTEAAASAGPNNIQVLVVVGG